MKLLTNIGCLAGLEDKPAGCKRGDDMNCLNRLDDAWLLIDGQKFAAFGSMASLDSALNGCLGDAVIEERIDMKGGWVFPSFCDSHTHIIYAGNRAGEFIDKINGLSYEEIARRGGGILNSADLLNRTDEDELYRQAMERVGEMIAKGTGSLEIKSGYGLTLEGELKMLRVARRIKESVPMEVKTTFLGAHAVGRAYQGRQGDYVEMVCTEMIPEVGRQGLADFVDVFCDEGFFTPVETGKILEAAAIWGMKPKIHANELAVSGGVQVGVEMGAVSVDHLERTGEAEIEALKSSSTIPTMLPGASFFLGMPYGNAKGMISAGLPLALASDYNPGSSPSGDMRFVGSLGCIKMKLAPEQVVNATTINGAYAMRLGDVAGSITVGKRADFFVTEPIPNLAYFYYAYATPLISEIWLRGEKL